MLINNVTTPWVVVAAALVGPQSQPNPTPVASPGMLSPAPHTQDGEPASASAVQPDVQPEAPPEDAEPAPKAARPNPSSTPLIVGGVVAGGAIIAVAASGGGGGGGGGGPTCAGAGTDPGAIGDVSVVLTWCYENAAAPGPDLDLFVTDPLGQTLSTTREGFALGPTPEGGEIDRDEDGACTTIPDDNGGGPERAFWPTGQAPVGTYNVGVVYTGACLPPGSTAQPGTANYTIVVYANGSPVRTFTGSLTSVGQRLTAGTVSYAR